MCGFCVKESLVFFIEMSLKHYRLLNCIRCHSADIRRWSRKIVLEIWPHSKHILLKPILGLVCQHYVPSKIKIQHCDYRVICAEKDFLNSAQRKP